MSAGRPRSIFEYELGEQKGFGSYGQVYRARHLATGKIVAIKAIKIYHGDPGSLLELLKRTLREIKLLRLLKGHPNVVSLEHVLEPPKSLAHAKVLHLVFEYQDQSLDSMLSHCIPPHSTIRYIFYQMLRGIHFLHSANVIHRDIKPGNVLLGPNGSVKICDFNLGRAMCVPGELVKDTINEECSSSSSSSSSAKDSKLPPLKLARTFTPLVVTRYYRPPDVELGVGQYGLPVDMWSAGCVLAEMYLGRPLFPSGGSSVFLKERAEQGGSDHLQLILSLLGTPNEEDTQWLAYTARKYLETYKKVQPQDLSKKFYSKVPSDAIDLLKKLLVFNPAKRLTAEEALNHPFFSPCVKVSKNYNFPLSSSPLKSQNELTALGRSMVDYYQFELKDDNDKLKFHTTSQEEIKKECEKQAEAVWKLIVREINDDVHTNSKEEKHNTSQSASSSSTAKIAETLKPSGRAATVALASAPSPTFQTALLPPRVLASIPDAPMAASVAYQPPRLR